MARTKKYLSPKGSKTARGFYRPIKRIEKNAKKTTKKSSNPIDVPSSTEEQLAQQLVQVKNLKAQLEEKLSLDTQAKPSSKQPEPDSMIDPKDLSIKLFDNDEDDHQDQKASPSDSKAIPQLPKLDLDDEVDFTSHDEKEKLEFLESQLNHKSEAEAQAKKELDKLKQEFEKERQVMQRQLSILRKDMHRQEPITHNRFFSLSKELGEVVKQMDLLVNSPQFKDPTVKVDSQELIDVVKPIRPDFSTIEPKIQAATDSSVLTSPKPAQPPPTDKPVNPAEKPPKPKKKVPKFAMIMGTTLTIVLLLVGIVWFSVSKRSDVSDQLLQEYLPETSAQNPNPEDLEKKIDQIIEDAISGGSTQEISQVMGESDQKYAESQADIPFSETVWDTITDPSLAIEINFPKNSSNFIKTETSITFIRKSGYIFKIQVIESALELTEYWKMIKASSLNYKVKETTFRDLPALFLELEDFAQYPGDKYLVKKDDLIYDIWYATFSNSLSDDDAKRIDIMLNSFKFLD